jgi:hypothetical protein
MTCLRMTLPTFHPDPWKMASAIIMFLSKYERKKIIQAPAITVTVSVSDCHIKPTLGII